MTHPHDDPAHVEHDPTGMRDLLAALPDPGPMPDDLVARITAALAQEARAAGVTSGPDAVAPVTMTTHPRAGSGPGPVAGPGGGSPAGGDVVPLHRRRPRLVHLGVAAAVVGAIGLGGVALTTWPGSLTAQLSANDSAGSSADSGVSGPVSGQESGQESGQGVGTDTKGGTEAGAFLAPVAGSGEVVVVMSGTGHVSTSLADSSRALDESGLDPIIPLTAESPGIGPIATPLGARACADALGVAPSAGILVDISEVDGMPAAVLVVHDGGGRTAYAVERSCTTGAPGLLVGPVPLP